MLSIALTGGIGSGKSTVTEYLTRLGYIVIDADKMARELTAPGGRAIPFIRENFGESYIATDGSMDRAKMRNLIFKDYSKKKLLEKGTTQVVIDDIAKIKHEAELSGTSAMFFDIPLLFENKQQDKYDKIWVVTADIDLRKKRVMKRDGINAGIIDLIIGSQQEDDEKIALADDVIYNNGTIVELHHIVDKLIQKYNL